VCGALALVVVLALAVAGAVGAIAAMADYERDTVR
jgi:hypothetical protein